MSILIDLVIISIILSTTYIGYRRGLISVMFKIFVFLVSLIIVFILYRPVANFIINNTQLDENISNAIRVNLEGAVIKDGKIVEAPENSKISTSAANLINSFATDAVNNAEEDAIEYVSIQLAEWIIRVGTMLGIYMISRIVLYFVKFASEIIANLPLLKTFNKAGGFIYGAIKGLLIVYLILTVFCIISPLLNSWGVIDSIEKSKIGSLMYNNNIILNIIK